MAGSIGYVVKEVTFPDRSVTKNYTDAEMSRLRAAYQARANASVGGTASQLQVWAFILGDVTDYLTLTVKNFEFQAAESAISVTPLNPT